MLAVTPPDHSDRQGFSAAALTLAGKDLLLYRLAPLPACGQAGARNDSEANGEVVVRNASGIGEPYYRECVARSQGVGPYVIGCRVCCEARL